MSDIILGNLLSDTECLFREQQRFAWTLRSQRRMCMSVIFKVRAAFSNSLTAPFAAPGMSFFADWKEKLDVLSSELKPIQARLMKASHHGHEDVHNAIERLGWFLCPSLFLCS